MLGKVFDYFSKVFASSAHLDEKKPMFLLPTDSELGVNVLCNENCTPLNNWDPQVLSELLSYLPQNELLSVSRTNRFFHELVSARLMKNLVFRSHPSLKSKRYWLISSGQTVVGGTRDIYHLSDGANEKVLAEKLLAFKAAISYKPILSCESLVVGEKMFLTKEGYELLLDLVLELIRKSRDLKVIEIRDKALREEVNRIVLSKGGYPTLESIIVDSIPEICSLAKFPNLRLLTVIVERDNLLEYGADFDFESLARPLSKISSLTIIDDEDASLRILRFFKEQCSGLRLTNLKSLKFNHYHGMHNYNTVLRNLSLEILDNFIDLSALENLEMELNCDEDCDCFSSFMLGLSKQLKSLKSVGLMEKQQYNKTNPVLKHQVYENWDLVAFLFLDSLPNKEKLTKLMIKNNPPIDGFIEDGLEGNYLRRRTLYATTLPKFTSLRQLVIPSALSVVSCYEQAVSDLLWNGCTCPQCEDHLPLFDNYLMTHQYFDYKVTYDFKDMITCRLFGFFADSLERRIEDRPPMDLIEHSKLPTSLPTRLSEFEILDNVLRIPPSLVLWNFHGYMKIICRDFKNDDDEIFYDEERFLSMIPDQEKEGCLYNELCFEALRECVDHFFQNNYLNNWLCNQETLKQLNVVVLGGVYYIKDRGVYNCVF